MRIIRNNTIEMQQGGAFPPFATYIPTVSPVTPTQTGQSSQQQQQQAGLLDEKQMKLLMEHGLPSDVETFFSMVNQLSTEVQMDPFSSNNISQQMNLIGSYLNKISWNENEFNRVTKTAEANGGMQEMAVTSDGRLVGMKDGKLAFVTAKEYADNMDKIQLLRNSDLAQYRATNPQLAFDSNIFNIIENGIGMEAINKLLWNTINNIGTNKEKGTTYVGKAKQISQGLEELLGDGPEGIYKVTTSNESQSLQAKEALKYLYTTLPQNAKALLSAKAVQMGMDATTGAQELIAQLVTSGLDNAYEQTADYDSSASSAIGTGGDPGKTAKYSAFDQFFEGDTLDQRIYHLNVGKGMNIDTKARVMNNLTRYDNKPLDTFDFLDSLIRDTQLGAAKKKSISMGGKNFMPSELAHIFVQNEVVQTYLPSKTDQNGNIIPDLELADRLDKAQKQVQNESAANGFIPAERKRQIYAENDVEEYWNIDSKKGFDLLVNKGDLHEFYLVDGYIASNHIPEGAKKYLEKVDDDEAESIFGEVHRARGRHATSKDNDPYKDVKLGEDEAWFWFNKDMYKGTVFIAVSPDKQSTQLKNSEINKPKGESMIGYQLNQAQNNLNRAKEQIQTNFQ